MIPPEERIKTMKDAKELIGTQVLDFEKVRLKTKVAELQEVLKSVNAAIQSSNMKNTILHDKIRAAIKDSSPAEDWFLSRKRMPDFDGQYYVYGFMHHSCGNVTPFHKIVECKFNQWVKSDVGEQMTYWRHLLPEPDTTDHEQEP